MANLPDPAGTLGRGAYSLGQSDVAEGATEITVTLPIKNTWYVPHAVPNWNTSFFETIHTDQQFQVTFAVPAPAGAILRWIVFT
jgi:hypothetical protein